MIHRIRRQILELNLSQERGALELQRRASRVFQEQVLPELDQLFSRIAPADRIVRLDRLDLDLGNISESGWERAFAERCIRQIAQVVADAAYAVGDTATAVQSLSLEEKSEQVLHYFLRTGLLPWYAKGQRIQDLEHEWLALSPETQVQQSRALLDLLRHQPPAMRRLLQQFSPVFSEKIWAAALALPPDTLTLLLREGHTPESARHTLPQRMALLHSLATLPPEALHTLASSQPARVVWRNSLPEMQAGRSTSLTEVLAVPSAAPRGADNTPPTPPPPAKRTSSSPEATTLPAALPQKEIEEQPENRISTPRSPEPLSRQRPEVTTALAEGVWIEQAGLVILAPYLTAFFQHLGVEWEAPAADALLDAEEAVVRAIYLLHYVATGVAEAEEHQILLPKILCGVPPACVLPRSSGLSSAEMQEATQLLEAVIRNWPVLRNTSPDALRDGFLHREGLLRWSSEQCAWMLQVERKAQDILLEKLPWPISVVKLPWMPEMLVVEW